jgi:hypothetical protein
MTSPRALLAAALALAGLLGGSAAAADAATPPASLLFVQETDSGTLDKVGASTYRLTLRGVSPSLTSFTDRPARAAGTERATAFIDQWHARGFDDDPPNAALVLHGAARDRDVVVLTISRPHYHPRTRTFTYTARPVKGTPADSLRAFTRRRDPVRELRFGAASLFIDNAWDLSLRQLTLYYTGVLPGEQLGISLENTAGVEFSPADGITFSTPGLWITQSEVTADRVTFSVDPATLPSDGALSFTVAFAADPYLKQFKLTDLSPDGYTYLKGLLPINSPLTTPIWKTGAEVLWF